MSNNNIKRKLNHVGILDNIITLASDRLNEWECSFVEDLNEKLTKKNSVYELTKKQEFCLLGIQDKYLKS